MAGPIRIGTCGFSYDDWVGPFYPANLKKREWFQFYASEFDCLEVNVSYYTWLSLAAVKSLVERAPADFRFSVKLHRSLTHQKNVDLAESISATREQNRAFEASGTLAAQLAQFPHLFRPTAESWERVERISEALLPLVVEFRHSDWQTPEALERLKKLGVSLCAVDEPQLEGLPSLEARYTGSPAYLRFHGRNKAKWFDHDKPHQRYDYLYTEQEMEELKQPVLEMSKKAPETLALFNNHYGAQAVTNARQLAEKLGRPTKRSQKTLF